MVPSGWGGGFKRVLAGRMSDRVKTFSFAEIVRDRDAAVRITDDGYFYAVDLSMVMTGKDRDHAGQVFCEKSLS